MYIEQHVQAAAPGQALITVTDRGGTSEKERHP